MVDTPAHGTAGSGSGDDVDTRQFYLTLTAGYYNENFHVDMPQTFHTSDRRLAMAAPALQAELDYTGLGEPPYTITNRTFIEIYSHSTVYQSSKFEAFTINSHDDPHESRCKPPYRTALSTGQSIPQRALSLRGGQTNGPIMHVYIGLQLHDMYENVTVHI